MSRSRAARLAGVQRRRVCVGGGGRHISVAPRHFAVLPGEYRKDGGSAGENRVAAATGGVPQLLVSPRDRRGTGAA